MDVVEVDGLLSGVEYSANEACENTASHCEGEGDEETIELIQCLCVVGSEGAQPISEEVGSGVA